MGHRGGCGQARYACLLGRGEKKGASIPKSPDGKRATGLVGRLWFLLEVFLKSLGVP